MISSSTFSLGSLPNPLWLASAAAAERGSRRASERGSLEGGRDSGSLVGGAERGSPERGSGDGEVSGSLADFFPNLACFTVAGSTACGHVT